MATRKQWRDAVAEALPSICEERGFRLTWSGGNSPAAVLEKMGARVHIAPGGIWFLGTNKKDVGPVMESIKASDSILRSDPCNLGLVEPYKQLGGIMAVDCKIPASATQLEGIVDAIGEILNEIAQCNCTTASASISSAGAKVKRRVTFEERCELAVVVAEAIVSAGFQSRVSPQLSGRVFGIADFAPILGSSGQYREELKSRELGSRERSTNEKKFRGEHVVPCKVVTALLLTPEFHRLDVRERVREVKRLLKIVYISDQEQRLLDRHYCLKDKMPQGHALLKDCISARLIAAGVSDVEAQIPKGTPPCGCGRCGI